MSTAKQPHEQWAPEDKRTALEVWAFQTDRNASETARILAEKHALDIPVRTIRRWVHDEAWDLQAAELYAELAPHHYERTKHLLVQASPAAGLYLLQVATGEVPPNKDRTAAAFGILDRVGFLPVSRAMAQAQLSSELRAPQVGDDAYGQLSDEELERIASGLLTPDNEPRQLPDHTEVVEITTSQPSTDRE